jgi:DNA-binding beta-propeller fold protein YncE
VKRRPCVVPRQLQGVGVSAVLLWTAAQAAAGAGAPRARLLVLDHGAPALHALDTTGRSLGSAALRGHPHALLASPDGERALVLDRGPGKDAGERGWDASARSALTIVATERMEVEAELELGWGLALDPEPLFSADGRRVAVLCPGFRAKKAEEALPAEVVIIDVETGRLAGRVTLDRPPVAWLSSGRGHRLYALLPFVEGNKKLPPQAAALLAVDLRTGSEAGRVPLEGDVREMRPSPDGASLYLLDRGRPSGKPDKNVNGRVQVVSCEPLALLSTLDAGSDPKGLFLEETSQTLVVPALTAPVKGQDQAGELRVIRGSKLEKTVPVSDKPLFLRRAPNGRQLFAVGERGLTVLSLPAFAPLREVPIEKPGINWTSDAQVGPPNELVTTADGRRGLVTYENSSKLLVLDLATGAKIGSLATGRKGVRLLKAAAATGFTAASYLAARDEAIRNRQTSFVYYRYDWRGARTTIDLGAGGQAYVLNTLSRDVTVVDTANATAGEKLAAGGDDLISLPGGRFLAVTSDTALHLIDTKADALAETWDLPGLLGLAVAPDGGAVAAVSERSVLFIDPVSGRVKGRVDSFQHNTDRLFLPAAPARVRRSDSARAR